MTPDDMESRKESAEGNEVTDSASHQAKPPSDHEVRRHAGNDHFPFAGERRADFENWLNQHKVDFTLAKYDPKQHAYGYRINTGCPCAGQHTDPNGPDDFYVFLSPHGYGAQCVHTSCGEWTWDMYCNFLEESDGNEISLPHVSGSDSGAMKSVPNPAACEEGFIENTPPKQFLFKTIEEGLTDFNKQFVYVRQNNLVVRLEDLRVFDPQKWASVQYGNYYYEEEKKGRDGAISVKHTQIAPLWLRSPKRNQLDSMTFAPGRDPIFDGKLNRWKGWGSKPEKGSIEPWAALVHYLFPNQKERHWFLQWLAYPIQHPGAKLTTSVVLIGREGVGKNSLLIPIERIYGQYAINITEAELYADFCPWKKDKQFIVGNEVGGERDKRQVMDKLKDLITSPTMIVNEKFTPHYELPNCANFVFTTNHPDPFYLTEGDRRFWVWQIPQDKPLPPEFFERFYAWADKQESIDALNYVLLRCSLSGFNPNAPAPMTEAKQDVIEIGRTRLETWIREKMKGEKNLYTVKELVEEWKSDNYGAKEGESAVTRTLKSLDCPKAHNGKQVKVKGEQLRLWILAASNDQRDRLLALDPSGLADEYTRERPGKAAVTELSSNVSRELSRSHPTVTPPKEPL